MVVSILIWLKNRIVMVAPCCVVLYLLFSFRQRILRTDTRILFVKSLKHVSAIRPSYTFEFSALYLTMVSVHVKVYFVVSLIYILLQYPCTRCTCNFVH
jgi:hypothetical protein